MLYEDPEDGVPKIHVRCDNYMAWVQEQNLPLHMHVQKGRTIRFDQVEYHNLYKRSYCEFVTIMKKFQVADHEYGGICVLQDATGSVCET